MVPVGNYSNEIDNVHNAWAFLWARNCVAFEANGYFRGAVTFGILRYMFNQWHLKKLFDCEYYLGLRELQPQMFPWISRTTDFWLPCLGKKVCLIHRLLQYCFSCFYFSWAFAHLSPIRKKMQWIIFTPVIKVSNQFVFTFRVVLKKNHKHTTHPSVNNIPILQYNNFFLFYTDWPKSLTFLSTSSPLGHENNCCTVSL